MRTFNRRTFFLGAGALALTAAVTLPTIGCTPNWEGILNTLITSGEAVLKVAEPNAMWLKPFESALTALQGAEAQWKAGSAITIIESALNTLAAVAAVIPFTAVYSPLIDILVAGIDAVLSAISPAPSGTKLAAAHNARVGRAKLKAQTQSAYKAQWNAYVATYPALAAAKI